MAIGDVVPFVYPRPIRDREETIASVKQLEANRNNARRSTGPKTDLGKARSRLNSCKHGLTGETVVIAGEDPADFEQLLQDLEDDLKPASGIEFELVARVAGYFWRLRRIPVFEAALLRARQTQMADMDIMPSPDAYTKVDMGRVLIHDARDSDTLGKLTRYEAALLNAVDGTSGS